MNQCKNGWNSSQKENALKESTLTVFSQHNHLSTCKIEPDVIFSIFLFGEQLSGTQFIRNWRFWNQMWRSTHVSLLFPFHIFNFATNPLVLYTSIMASFSITEMHMIFSFTFLSYVLNDKTGIFTCILSISVWISWQFKLISFKTAHLPASTIQHTSSVLPSQWIITSVPRWEFPSPSPSTPNHSFKAH